MLNAQDEVNSGRADPSNAAAAAAPPPSTAAAAAAPAAESRWIFLAFKFKSAVLVTYRVAHLVEDFQL